MLFVQPNLPNPRAHVQMPQRAAVAVGRSRQYVMHFTLGQTATNVGVDLAVPGSFGDFIGQSSRFVHEGIARQTNQFFVNNVGNMVWQLVGNVQLPGVTQVRVFASGAFDESNPSEPMILVWNGTNRYDSTGDATASPGLYTAWTARLGSTALARISFE